jgi:ELWxxDGT repeat protein
MSGYRDVSRPPAALLRLLAAALVSFCVSVADAGTAHLVRDINSQVIPVSSYPLDFADFGTHSVFDADDGIHSYEPWITDGTAAGTFFWGDLTRSGGGVGRQFYQVSNLLFTVTSDQALGTLLSITDGTPAGSKSLSYIPAANGVNPSAIGALGNRFLFSIFNPATGNRDLWASDGTDAGTARVSSSTGAAFSATSTFILNGKLYFLSLLADDTIEPWVSDGTRAGTFRLSAIPNIAPELLGTSQFAQAGNYVVFAAATTDTGRELWRIDPSTNAVSLVKDIAPGTGSSFEPNESFGTVGGVAVFTASATADSNTSLWRTDGTSAGTFVIAPVTPFQATGTLYFGTGSNGRILFFAGSPAADLWATDGTAAGTIKLASGVTSNGVQEFGGHYYFSTANGSGSQIWTSDGTAPSTKVLAQVPGTLSGLFTGMAGDATQVFVRTTDSFQLGGHQTGSIYRIDRTSAQVTPLLTYSFSTLAQYGNGVFAFARGKLYFDNEDAQNGREIWTSDGTTAGTALLKDIAAESQTQSSNPADFISFNNQLYFTADDGISGKEVWHSDGTSQGTALLIDANPGIASSSPSDLSAVDGALYFLAMDSSGTGRLWRSDGTTVGTKAIAAVSARPVPLRSKGCDSRAVGLNGSIYFAGFDSANGMQLWKSDGTAAGTQRVTSLSNPSFGATGFCFLTVLGGQLYFQANDGLTGSELWVSDGTAAGTHEVSDIFPGLAGSTPIDLAAFSGALYFLAADTNNGYALWSSAGSAASTLKSPAFGAGALSSINVLPNTLLVGSHSDNGPALWSLSGRTATPILLAINYGAELGLDPPFVNQGFVYFVSGTQSGGGLDIEPWVTDGTASGTHVLVNLDPSQGSVPTNFTDFSGITVFNVELVTSFQLWRTNGSLASVVGNIDIGPTHLAAGQNLFYVSSDVATGYELWALSNDAPLAVDDAGTVVSGKSIAISVLSNDSDADGSLNTGSVVVTANPLHGSAVVGADGTITYTPAASFSGADSLAYTVNDDQGASSAPAKVQITVTAAPATPSSGGGGGGGGITSTAAALLALLVYRTRVRPLSRRRD